MADAEADAIEKPPVTEEENKEKVSEPVQEAAAAVTTTTDAPAENIPNDDTTDINAKEPEPTMTNEGNTETAGGEEAAKEMSEDGPVTVTEAPEIADTAAVEVATDSVKEDAGAKALESEVNKEVAPGETETPAEAIPAETEGAPAETEGAPAETEGAPAETEGAPAEIEDASPETEGTPVETEGAPAETAPTESEPNLTVTEDTPKKAEMEAETKQGEAVLETDTADVQPPATTPAGEKPMNSVEGEDQQKPSTDAEEPLSALVPQEIPSATVKFVLLPTAQVATMKCALNQTLKELKDHFAVELKIPSQVILLLHEGANIADDKTLADLGVGPNSTVQLEMQSADPVNTPIKAFRPRQEYVMPDVITVKVETEPQRYKDVVVEVERSTTKKPFLGGYRHKQTGVEFHHASAQTGQKPRPPSDIERFCRDTQTYQMKHIRQQTSEDTSTQMTKIGVFVSNMADKLLIPRKYTTAEEHHKMILQKVVILQKYWRRWLALRYVTKLKVDRQKRLDWEKQEEIKKREEKELRIKREFERRMNPKTKEDFDLLYAALEKWRLEEMDKIDQTLSGAERKAALCQLLDQETQLIGSIGRHKKDADSDNREKIIQSFLNKAAAPKKWRGPDGCFTEMDTPYTIRAQELRDIYNSICFKYLTQDERLDVLLTLKHTVKEHDCKLTQEIIELIDREADLLMRGVRDSNLEGLRKRIATLFLQYIKTPTFNPEAARLLKVPQDPSTLRKNIYYCASCNQYLPSVEFQLSTNSRTVGRCRKCRHLDNDGRTRQDYSHYRLMLRDLRRLEESYGDDSKVAFLLQENDLRYLVEKIWNSQSIVSAWDDLYDLILVRWDKHREWSPWNCVLLTKEESSAHERLETLAEGYGKELIHKVQRKHALARNYFSRLPGMSEHMRKRVTEPHDGPAVEGISVN